MTNRQLPLDLPARQSLGRADFFEARCNAAALAAALSAPAWPGPRMIIAGPAGSGRTHLAHVFAEATAAWLLTPGDLARPDAARGAFDAPAIVLDDADRVAGDPAAEEALFHLHNGADRRAVPLLLTARDLPGTWGIALPDLASRLAACPVTRLQAPDDQLLRMVLAKLFDDRQLAVSGDLLEFTARRMHRSLDAARHLVAAIDRASLAERRKVSQRLVARVLAETPEFPT